MTWTAAETPHEGDPGAVAGGGSPSSEWVVPPLPPGALGADPTARQDDAGPVPGPAPLPLTGPLAEALAATRAGADEASSGACYLSSLSPQQRVEALREGARARDVLDAALLRLTASFTPEDLDTLGMTSAVDLLLTHTGADPRRASTEVNLAKALTVPPAPLLIPVGTDVEGDEGDDGDDGDDDGEDLGIDLAAEAVASAAMSPAHTHSGEGLGRVGAAHAAGAVSTDVAALARRTVASLPARTRRAHGALADAMLATALPGLSHAQAVIACEVVAHKLDPDRADRGFDPDAVDKRYLNYTVHDDGVVDVRARLDAVTGAEFKAAIDHYAQPDPTVHAPLAVQTADQPGDEPLPGLGDPEDAEDAGGADAGSAARPGSEGARVAVRDERTAPQRRADALGLLARLGRTGDETRGGEPPRIIATATADQLTGVPGSGQGTCETTRRGLSTTALQHLACTALLHTVTLSCQGGSAAALALGRSVRLFSPAQRRAMLARDGGCVIPGCTSPPGWWEAHHVHAWEHGGPTDVDHGVLLCGRHHILVTLGVWEVRMVHGAPQVRPPASIDPLQRWLLSPRRAVEHSTARRAEQLLLLTTTPTDRAHPHHLSCQGRGHLEHGRGSAAPPPGHGGPPQPDEGPPPDIPSARSTCDC
ncbi:MAG: DUF222 domain-containing protein [Quadrisphaera sp.]